MQYRGHRERRGFIYLLAALFCVLLVAIYYKAVAGTTSESGGAAASSEERVVPIANRAELRRALRNENGGYILELAPGNYGSIAIRGNADNPRFEQPVTIRSAERCNPAVFERLTINGVSNLALEALHFEDAGFFDRPPEELVKPNGQLKNLDLLRTDDVSNIAVRDSTFVGPTVDLPSGHRLNGYGYGFGWRGVRVRSASFTNNRMTNLYKGLSVRNAAGLTIADNTLSRYRSDGIYLTQSEDVDILNNRMVDPLPYVLAQGRGDHPDFMQLADIAGGRIENNYMDIGLSAEASQGIFSGPASDLMVRNNIIITRSLNGLVFSALTDSEISNNLVVSAGVPRNASRMASGGGRRNTEPQFRINANYENVIVSNNVASRFSRNFPAVARRGSLSATGNVTLQNANPREGSYYAYLTDGAAARDSSGTRIGNVWLSSVPADAGPDPGKFAYLQGDPLGSSSRCGS